MISVLQSSALLVTLFSETILGAWILRKRFAADKVRRVNWPAIFILLGANLFTHPLAWTLYNRVERVDLNILWWAIEAAVWFTETLIYRNAFKISFPRAAWVSFLLNVASILSGYFLREALG